MKKNDKDVPRREFLKFTAALTGATAYGIYATTDAKSQPSSPPKTVRGGGGQNYGY